MKFQIGLPNPTKVSFVVVVVNNLVSDGPLLHKNVLRLSRKTPSF